MPERRTAFLHSRDVYFECSGKGFVVPLIERDEIIGELRDRFDHVAESSGALDGFNFSAATTAIADGTDTTASFDASFRYIFRVQMDPGARFNLMKGARQANAAE